MKCPVYDVNLYQKTPQIVLGFHGCDQSVVDRVLFSSTEHLHPSHNDYDWLGGGIYFWLNDPVRAYEWAEQASKRKSSRVKHPAVIGAVIDLGNCLNLCERASVQLLQKSYEDLSSLFESLPFSINDTFANKKPDSGGFMLLRELDCLIIEHVHELMQNEKISFDTVYGYFQEGQDAFPGAGIKEKTHIQIAVRNTDCIKGYFLPRIKS